MRKRYYENGNRTDYETPYFIRREQLYVGAIMCLLYPEEPLYLERLQDVIWAVCDEYSWLLPAHTFNEFEHIDRIALFSSETAAALTEICRFLGDRLDKAVTDRAEKLIDERIIKLFDEKTADWEDLTMNWSAVCGNCVATVLMYLRPDLFDKYEDRFLKIMECFLSGYPEDGCCMEGVSYWQYGFGSFTYFADNLYRYTNGRINLFENKKVKEIAEYGQKIMLHGCNTVSFADSDRDALYHGAFVDILHRKYPDEVIEYPTKRKVYFVGEEDRWFDFSRGFLYDDIDAPDKEPETGEYYFKEAAQLIVNKPKYSFAIKAGNNGEPHNHNDVGSFIIADKTGQVLCDIGSGRYTYEYFCGQRYDILCCGSQGHSVPMIDGKCQSPGEEYCGEMSYDPSNNSAVLRLENAYRLPQLEKLERRFNWNDSEILLEDNFEGTMQTITERFVSTVKPEIYDDYVKIGGIILKYSAEGAAVSAEEKKHKMHKASENDIETVYCIDFVLKSGVKTAKFSFEINA